MASKRFVGRVGGRAVLLIAALAVFAWLLPQPGLFATKLVVGVVALAAAASLYWQVRRTNRDVARFVSAIVYRDFHQAFRSEGQGGGFDDLGDTLNRAIHALRDDRAAREAELRFAAALADGAPTPLLAIAPDDTVELANKAARRLFADRTNTTIAGFGRYGEDLVAALRTARPRARQQCRIVVDGLPQRAILSTAEVDRQGRPWRVVAVQIIQRELDAAEIAVQADLVRVLTHEIMNSMTPVTSLAETAATTMATLDPDDREALDDARAAVATLARRAAGIMHFVETYRSFTRTPTLDRARFMVRPWTEEVTRLFAATPAGERVALTVTPIAPELTLSGDANLLAQIVLNLLKNAAEAAHEHTITPRVTLAIEPLPSGRLRIAVADNGPGIAPDRRDEVFLPFFTTKRTGTGVGLSFARQIVLLHGGLIGIVDNADGGATLEITL